jgi:hypothetical protein
MSYPKGYKYRVIRFHLKFFDKYEILHLYGLNRQFPCFPGRNDSRLQYLKIAFSARFLMVAIVTLCFIENLCFVLNFSFLSFEFVWYFDIRIWSLDAANGRTMLLIMVMKKHIIFRTRTQYFYGCGSPWRSRSA